MRLLPINLPLIMAGLIKPFNTDARRTPGRALSGATLPSLRRESDGSITIVSLGSTWQPTLARQGDGSVSVGGA